MTKKQNSLYWRTWSQVRKTLVTLGGYEPAEADAQRHDFHHAALGKNKSSKTLTNADLDKVLDQFRAALILENGPTTGPSRAASQPIARLLHRIGQLGLPDPYIAQIALDQFKTTDWRHLPETQLTHLSYTLTSRARSMVSSP